MQSKIRLCFRLEHGGTKQVALCTNEYDEILKTAKDKLNLGKKAIGRARLIVEATGVELTKNDPNLPKEIKNGSIIVVQLGEKSTGKNDREVPSLHTESQNILPPLTPSSHGLSLKSNESQKQYDHIEEKLSSKPDEKDNEINFVNSKEFDSQNIGVDINLANPAPILTTLPTGPLQPYYTAVFLSKESSNELLSAYPPCHRNVIADHITLTYAPNAEALEGIPIGSRVQIQVSEIICDNKSQVARVSFPNDNTILTRFMSSPQNMHITMSTAANVRASRSNHLLDIARSNPTNCDEEEGGSTIIKTTSNLIIDGIVGVLVRLTESQSTLASLSKSVLSKLKEFSECKVPGSLLEFRGGMLNSSERAAIHKFCEDRGIISNSDGPKHNRKMTLKIPIELDEGKKQKRSKNLRLSDAKNIYRNYVCVSMDVFSLIEWEYQGDDSLHISPIGKFSCSTYNGKNSFDIDLDPKYDLAANAKTDETLLRRLLSPDALPPDLPTPIVVIMRGLPGSGKSSLARTLKEKLEKNHGKASIVSADFYFERNGSYQDNFALHKLKDAHSYCRESFQQELSDQDTTAIIVDNTNSTLAEYKHYINASRKAGKRLLVVEMLCRSENEMQNYYHRCVHRVPMQSIGRMHARWEIEKDALLFVSINREK